MVCRLSHKQDPGSINQGCNILIDAYLLWSSRQGSILEPIGCIILEPISYIWYINDLPNELSRLVLDGLSFADDTKLARIIYSESDISQFQQDIDKVFDWSTNWRMNFNLGKCEFVLVTRKKTPFQSSYHIGNHVISQADTQKDLAIAVNGTTTLNGTPTFLPCRLKLTNF